MLKRVGNFACRKTLRRSVEYGLTLNDHDEKDDFQNQFFRKCVYLKY